VMPVIRLFSFLLDKTAVPIAVRLLGDETPIVARAWVATVATDSDAPRHGAPATSTRDPEADGGATASGVLVPLRRIAWGRSGDKGNASNIGLIARRVEFAAVIRAQVTPHRVARYFAHYLRGDVTRWELPGANAFNYLLADVLGGGGTASLRHDPQGKAYAQMLLDLPVRVPDALLHPPPG